MTATETVVIELPPTKTYHRRRVRYTPGCEGHSDCRMGTVAIRMCKHANRNLDSDTYDTYGLDRDTDPLPEGALAAFILRNDVVPAERGRREFYRLVVYPKGVVCNCKASNCGSESCKHRDSVACLYAGGHLS